MATKIFVEQISRVGPDFNVYFAYGNGTTITAEDSTIFSASGIGTVATMMSALTTAIIAWGVTNSLTITIPDIIWIQAQSDWNESNTILMDYVLNKPTINTLSFNNAPSRSIVTGTGATGFQVSSTRNANVQYSPTMVTTASISGNASDVIVFEIAPTNSATAGDWVEIGRLTNAQALSLAITLQSVQTTSGILGGIIPTGYYAKMRAITSGTVTNSYSSGQEVLL